MQQRNLFMLLFSSAFAMFGCLWREREIDRHSDNNNNKKNSNIYYAMLMVYIHATLNPNPVGLSQFPQIQAR